MLTYRTAGSRPAPKERRYDNGGGRGDAEGLDAANLEIGVRRGREQRRHRGRHPRLKLLIRIQQVVRALVGIARIAAQAVQEFLRVAGEARLGRQRLQTRMQSVDLQQAECMQLRGSLCAVGCTLGEERVPRPAQG